MKIFFYFNLLVCLVVSFSSELAFSKTTEAKQHILLISGSASSAGKMELGKLTSAAHATGHKYYFSGYYKILKDLGLPAFECLKVEDKDSRTLLERSVECKMNLRKYIESNNLGEKSITIIGHSMGGNIARLVAYDMFLSKYIKNVLTISTPNRGTLLADYIVDEYENGDSVKTEFYRLIIKVLEFSPDVKPYFFELHSKRTLGEEYYHAQDVPMVDGINYFSISNYLKYPALSMFNLTWNILDQQLRDHGQQDDEYGFKSDGVIPVPSMIFGKHLELVEADHGEGLCIGSLYFTPGCRNMKKALYRFFVNELKIVKLPQVLE